MQLEAYELGRSTSFDLPAQADIVAMTARAGSDANRGPLRSPAASEPRHRPQASPAASWTLRSLAGDGARCESAAKPSPSPPMASRGASAEPHFVDHTFEDNRHSSPPPVSPAGTTADQCFQAPLDNKAASLRRGASIDQSTMTDLPAAGHAAVAADSAVTVAASAGNLKRLSSSVR